MSPSSPAKPWLRRSEPTAAVDNYGKLTIWVDNAGGSAARVPLTELSRQQWDDRIELNQTAVWVGITTAARYVQTGSIINISSGAGTGPVPGSGHYGAAKAAMEHPDATVRHAAGYGLSGVVLVITCGQLDHRRDLARRRRGQAPLAPGLSGHALPGCDRSNRRPCTVISSSLNHGAGLSPLR